MRFALKVGGDRGRIPFDAYIPGVMLLGLILGQALGRRGLPQAPDALLHFYRAVIWRSAWDAGVVWPRWDTLFYQGYGYPLFNFYPPLLYLSTAALSYLTPGVEVAFRAILASICLAYPLGMYLWARDLVGRHGAFLAAAAYSLAAYRFRELYFLGGYAQFLAWSLYPWILYFLARLAGRKRRGYFIGVVATLAALLLTHNISALIFAPVLLVAAVALSAINRRERAWPVIVLALLSGTALAATFWLPALVEARFVKVEALTRGTWDVQNNFVHAWELVASPKPLDDRALLPLMPFTFGPLHLAVAGIGVLALLRRGLTRAQRTWGALAVVGLIVSVFMMLPPSLPVWRVVPVIKYVEYPWRLFGPALLCSSLLIGLALTWLDAWPRLQWAAALLGALTLVLAAAVYEFPRPFVALPGTPAGYLSFETIYRSMGTTGGGEYLSRWTSAVPPVAALAPDGSRTALLGPAAGQSGSVLAAGPRSLRLQVQQDRPGPATLAQFYFPGWTAQVDGTPAAIEPAPGSGAIRLNLPAGEHRITLAFGDTTVRRVAELASLVALLSLAWMVLRWRRWVPAIAAGSASAHPSELREDSGRVGQGLASAAALAILLLVMKLWIEPHTSLFRYRSAPGEVPAQQRLQDATIDGQVALLGYDVDRRGVTEGDELHVRLYWQALRPVPQDYASYVQLIGGPDRQEYAGSNHQHPGNVPVHSWSTEQYVIDDHYVRVPAGTPPVPLRLQAGLFRLGTGERLGQIDLPEQIYVHAAHPPAAADVPGGPPIRFGAGIRLLGHRAEADGNLARVTLYWQAGNSPGADYQVFVQLLDATGRVVAQSDSSPVGGLYPTSLWEPGQVIADVHEVPVPAGQTVASALLGLYRLDTMQRLPATRQDGSRWPDDAVRVPFGGEPGPEHSPLDPVFRRPAP